MKTKEMKNGEIVRRFKTLQKQSSKLTDKFIAAGLGNLRPSDMRKRLNCALSIKYIELLDEMSALKIEAECRYGPDLISIESLIK